MYSEDQYDNQIEVEFQDEESESKAIDNKMDLADYKNFKRNPIKFIQKSPITCMNIDIAPCVKYLRDQNNDQYPDPMIKIYAVTNDGNSLQIDVKGFKPYFYSELPRNLAQNQPKEIIQEIRININRRFAEIQSQKRKKNDNRPPNQNAITDIVQVKRRNIRNYVPDQFAMDQYWRIQTSTPNVINPLRKMFQQQTMIEGVQLPHQTFESNIPYVLRFMIDCKIVGMGWQTINKYRVLRRQTDDQAKKSSKDKTQKQKQSIHTIPKCQIEIQCQVQDIIPQPQTIRMPPLRILSFDIECAAEHGFPDASIHQIIQIACVCKTSNQNQEDYRVVFVLNGADKISGAHVINSNNQKQLLLNFQKLMISYDPDFITGYNMVNFDLNYILERSKTLNMKSYGFFGRSRGVLSTIKNSNFQSKIMGNRQTKQINIDGRIQLDMLIHMHKQHKLSSYRLNNVAYEILKDQKEDVHHTQIYKLFKESSITRKRLAIYCIKDAELPLRLMEKLCCLYNYSQMARVTGVPINFLLNRGQQIKVMSQLLRNAKEFDYISPTQTVKKNDNEIGYEGAYVLDPEIGYYDDPIATLDFASLYPSIMIAHNLCYTTLIRPDQFVHYNLDKKKVTQTPQKVFFVKKQIKRGLLPKILQDLLTARKKAKLELKDTNKKIYQIQDKFQKDQVQKDDQQILNKQLGELKMMANVLQGRQLALKISANSVYGFTGALVGQLPCLQISSSVTGFGRQMIQNTRDTVKTLYPGSEVIYGDTDSVMVKFKLQRSLQVEGSSKQKRTAKIKQSMDFGRKAAIQVTEALFAGMDPIKLQFQKVYCPYLLMAKKRYAGVYYSSRPDKHDKVDKKGIESVRRDNCVLIRKILEEVILLVLCESDDNGTQRAVNYIKEQISLLVQNKIDISELVISKAITKKTGDSEQEDNNGKKADKKGSKNTYKVKQGHVQLAEKMKKRDGNTNIGIGDRISYVMINGQKGSKNYNNTENPTHVLQQDLPIDYDYYINKQIKPPLERLLKKTKMIDNFDALFSGDHTKKRYIPSIGKSNFFSKFVQKKQTCLNCPTITLNNADLCERCEPHRQQIMLKKQQAQLCKMSYTYNKMWQQCIKCQGSKFQEILCRNQDCPIFYRRIKIKKDLAAKKKQIQKFIWDVNSLTKDMNNLQIEHNPQNSLW